MDHHLIRVLLDRAYRAAQRQPVTHSLGESLTQQVRSTIDAPLLGPALERVQVPDTSPERR